MGKVCPVRPWRVSGVQINADERDCCSYISLRGSTYPEEFYSVAELQANGRLCALFLV